MEIVKAKLQRWFAWNINLYGVNQHLCELVVHASVMWFGQAPGQARSGQVRENSAFFLISHRTWFDFSKIVESN